MASKDYERIEVPGVGEVRARPGTSTLELAGAVKVWHDKAKTAWVDGFTAGGFTATMLLAAVAAVYYIIGK